MRPDLARCGRDVGIAMLALGTVPVLRFALPRVGLRRVRASFGTVPSARRLDLPRVRRIHRLVSGAARVWPGASCLPVAVTTEWLLGREGLAAELRLGVCPTPDGIEAHAWIEHAGVAFGARPGSRFAALGAPCALETPCGSDAVRLGAPGGPR
jgi:hypothetical protein